MLSGNGVGLVLTNAAIDFLADAGYDPEFGARPVKRPIQNYLLNDLSKKLLAQEVDRSKPITCLLYTSFCAWQSKGNISSTPAKIIFIVFISDYC